MASNNLLSMVRDITYFYIKFYYDKELIDTKQKTLDLVTSENP